MLKFIKYDNQNLFGFVGVTFHNALIHVCLTNISIPNIDKLVTCYMDITLELIIWI